MDSIVSWKLARRYELPVKSRETIALNKITGIELHHEFYL
jgi:hypothetical protein